MPTAGAPGAAGAVVVVVGTVVVAGAIEAAGAAPVGAVVTGDPAPGAEGGGVWPSEVNARAAEHRVTVSNVFIILGKDFFSARSFLMTIPHVYP
jgi:hypothetical protein